VPLTPGPLSDLTAPQKRTGAAANFLCTFNYCARVIDVTFEWQIRVYAAINSHSPWKNKTGFWEN
jgi:hypothetical protein